MATNLSFLNVSVSEVVFFRFFLNDHMLHIKAMSVIVSLQSPGCKSVSVGGVQMCFPRAWET